RGVGIYLRQPELYFYHSFVTGALARRASQSKQALLRACNNRARDIDCVLDLTAGWGADSLTLAYHGQRVTLLEQNELIRAILAYSLARLAEEDATGAAVAARLSLLPAEAGAYLRALDDTREFDCIYLDPMFPAHKSGARPAKEMQILQALTHNRDIEACFELALSRARRRVVVKRPAKAPTLTEVKPDIVYREKSIRFDVYLTH
ncbi:MAG: rRNA methyltransferase, partial [Gammaproteobacteria bacterium]